MSTKTRPRVSRMDEDEMLVRGTLDPVAALGVAIHDEPDDVYEIVLRLDDDTTPGEVADQVLGLIGRAQSGWYRKVHCLPGSYGEFEGWAWQLGYAHQGDRGAFPGVYFRQVW